MDKIREQLIEILNDVQRHGAGYTEYERHGIRLDDEVWNEEVADYLISKGVTIERWIPVSEMLPEDMPENKGKKVINCIVTPAMPSGCSMNILQKELPDRVYDVGIAEGHAVTFSAGMAKAGLVPYCNIYSSFLQRAYDNIIHDVALPRLHVVFCIDRAGIVGNDGATHHGLLDLAYLRPIPNMVIGAPMTDENLEQMVVLAKDYDRADCSFPIPMNLRLNGSGWPISARSLPHSVLTSPFANSMRSRASCI